MNINIHEHKLHKIFKRIPDNNLKYSFYDILHKYYIKGYIVDDNVRKNFGWKYTQNLDKSFEVEFSIYDNKIEIDSYIGTFDYETHKFEHFNDIESYIRILMKYIKRDLMVNEILDN